MKPGQRNSITDVPGILVGNASDARLRTGSTVVTSDRPFTAAVHVMGGAPGSRETDLLAPESTIPQVDALVLSGGSAFGLDAASGVMEGLRDRGRGFKVRDTRIPLVPAAIILDIGSRESAAWGDDNPWRRLGRAAYEAAADDHEIGTVGAGTGATSANLMGGLGAASSVLSTGATVGAIVAANPIGQVTVGEGPEFWAAPFEIAEEFGRLGPGRAPVAPPLTKVELRGATVIAIVATDLALAKPDLKRMAVMAHDGIARAVVPSHTPYDGDLIFAASTGRLAPADPHLDLIGVGHAAATCLARAIARAIYAAKPLPGNPLPTWRERYSPGK